MEATNVKEEGNEDSTQRRWVRSKAELLYNKRFDTEFTPAMIWLISLIPGALHETTWFQIEANVIRAQIYIIYIYTVCVYIIYINNDVVQTA